MTGRVFVSFIRTWLPAIVVLGGIVLIVVRGDDIGLEGGAGIIGAGLSIWLLNVLMRVGLSNEGDRKEEEDARAFFDRTGVWPDEASDETRVRDGRDPANGLTDSRTEGCQIRASGTTPWICRLFLNRAPRMRPVAPLPFLSCSSATSHPARSTRSSSSAAPSAG